MMNFISRLAPLRLWIKQAIIPFSLGLLVTATFVMPTLTSADAKKNEEIYRQLGLFGDIFQRVRESYVDEVNEKELIEAAINGMLTSLDPHSSFLNTENFSNMQVQTKGKFGGLGIEITMESGLIKIVSPIDDTPAAKAGLQPEDYIIAVDGEAILDNTF